jgi:cytochrome P450
MQPAAPPRWTSNSGGYWLVSGYHEVRSLLTDTRRFSSRQTEIPHSESKNRIPPVPFDLDPPQHTEIRRVLDPLTRKSRIRLHEQTIRQTARAIAARLCEREEFELMDDFGIPLIATALWDLLGLNKADWPIFTDLSRVFTRRLADPSGTADWSCTESCGHRPATSRPAATPSWLKDQGPGLSLELAIFRAIQNSQWEDGGLISSLCESTWCTYLPDRTVEIANIVVGLAGAALVNTIPMLASAVQHMETHPDDRELLRRPDARADSITEEMLRLYPPVSPGRIVRRDTTLAGVQLHVGDFVLSSIHAANRDPRIFERPDDISLDRSRSHLSLGAGRHHCVGSSLARIILAAGLGEFSSSLQHHRICGRSRPIGGTPQRVPWQRLWLGPN